LNNFNDQYYDLDDDFIDDGQMFGVVGQDEMAADLHIGDTHIYSEYTGNMNDFTETPRKNSRARD